MFSSLRSTSALSIAVLFLAVTSSSCRTDDSKTSEPKTKKASDSLPGLPDKDLPPSTRAKPDPAKSSYTREAVYVRVDERVQPDKGEAYTPTVKVLENYLKEYLRRSGHPIAAAPEAAVYRLEGDFDAKLESTLKVLGAVTGWKYLGSSTIHVLDHEGQELETFAVPQLLQESGRGEESAVLNLRRHMAKIQWDKLCSTGKTFTNAEVVSLINSLASQADGANAATTEDIAKKLADIGFPSVPYLLEALSDNRIVRVPSNYPGLKGKNLDDLHIYHIADKALEEIFQKVSRMGLEIGPEDAESQKLRQVVIKGWENEWRHFCKPYAESQQSSPPRVQREGASAPATPPAKPVSEKNADSK